jgi:DNA-binding Xre family transcriptional regulator
MYIDYSKLWKLLVEKHMRKTDLMELTGISSRVLAKLSKNETVTTDTIARICTALRCDVGDIMECTDEERLSVYAAYKKYGKCIAETETVQTVQFTAAGKAYTVYRTKQAANRSIRIHCREDGAVYCEKCYAIGTVAVTSEESLLVKPHKSTDEAVIVLIKGKPSVITGLDENGFVSSRGTRRSRSDIYVMSEAAFKLFSPSDI